MDLDMVIVVATIFYMVYGKYKQISRGHTTKFNETRVQENKMLVSSSSPPPSQNWEYHVFVSFRGTDVREGFLSHLLKEFKRKGINPFVDNEMKKGGSITPELKRAIKGSKIAIVLLSKNYASSAWCLNELVKIIKCRSKIGQKVITIFFQVEPTDVKKQTGEFGKVFKETCKGKTVKLIQKWKEALVEVATIAGYDSTKWIDEASAIEEVVNDISTMLNHLAPSHYLDRFIGMEAHMEKMKSLLCLDLVDEVRMIGIWGPPGIGKSTICRYLYDQLSSSNFQLKAIMVNIKQSYPNPCFDEGSAQLQLQNDMLSKMINHKDIEITHLGAAKDRLKDKKVLLIIDDVDQHAQLVALAEDSTWFGPGSRIIIATEDKRILLAHEIQIHRIYKVNYPSNDEALQMFCMYAFRQKFPYDGFTKLAREITYLVGNLPLGLQIMGSYFLRRPKHEWIEALPKLWSCLDGKIESILKFSYDALCDEYKYLFLHIACYFNMHKAYKVETYLAESFTNVRKGIQVLVEKSLISIESRRIIMHRLLIKLGQEIVCKQSIRKRQFLIGDEDICQVLTDNTSITRSVVGINTKDMTTKEKLTISDKAFEGMSNLQFLIITHQFGSLFSLSGCWMDIFSKLRLVYWEFFPMTCWPTTAKLEFLVELNMRYSNLEKLWEGIKPLPRLKWINLRNSKNLKKVPNLSTATSLTRLNLKHCSSLVELPCSIGNTTNLQKLNLSHCSSLVELPYSIGNATNLRTLNLSHCSSLMELPYSIGNLTNLQILDLGHCSSLMELPCSIGNATNLKKLDLSYISSLVEFPSFIENLHEVEILILQGCSKLEFLPTNINLEQLYYLDFTDCLLLKTFPEISTNIKYLYLTGTVIKEVPSSIRLWSHLEELRMPYRERFMKMPHVLDTITELDLTDSKETEIGTCIKRFTRLRKLVLNGMQNLVSIPQLHDSLLYLDAENCESLETLHCSFRNPKIRLNFRNCFKLNQEAKDLIIHTPTRENVILPVKEVPTYFDYRASGNILTMKLNDNEPLDTSKKYRGCVLLVDEGVWNSVLLTYSYDVASKCRPCHFFYRTYKGSGEGILSENLCIFNVEIEEVTSTELLLEFNVETHGSSTRREIKECGLVRRLT